VGRVRVQREPELDFGRDKSNLRYGGELPAGKAKEGSVDRWPKGGEGELGMQDGPVSRWVSL